VQIGIASSCGHPENGMPMDDMRACVQVANELDEIIVFRSTGPWSRRWLSADPPYPSKNFHVKGKSSDWGPQAGLVPRLGQYSKVGHEAGKALKGTGENTKGIDSGFATAITLSMSRAEIDMQLTLACEQPPRTALVEVRSIRGSECLVLGAFRSGDGVRFNFIAVPAAGRYNIMLPPDGPISGHMDTIVDRIATGKLQLDTLRPLEVMASNELGANQRPMTGDYDLMAICPRWSNYMARSEQVIEKSAIVLNHGQRAVPVGQVFAAGSALDKVMDMRLHTGAKTNFARQKTLPVNGHAAELGEHGDMGNLTPRILRAINRLNIQMGSTGDNAALRRVHHNAESHRHANFGALVSRDMEQQGDGFPLTAFHPRSALSGSNSLAAYGDVCTIERMAEFRTYAAAVQTAGFYVPRHWAWNMSIRDTANTRR